MHGVIINGCDIFADCGLPAASRLCAAADCRASVDLLCAAIFEVTCMCSGRTNSHAPRTRLPHAHCV